MSVAIERIDPQPDRRIVAISDVHGSLSLLKALLHKVELKPDDLLLLVGDLTEKGEKSLETLRFVMELRKTIEVHAVIGNVDATNLRLVADDSPETQARFANFVTFRRDTWGNSLYLDMLRELGMKFDESADMLPYMRAINTQFAPELAFLRSLPAVIDAPNHIFVHAALPTENMDALQNCALSDCIKADAFASRDVHFRKTVVVGHWPVALYSDKTACFTPIFDRKRNVFSIDGGNAVKEEGQLNALILPDAYSQEASFTAVDPFPKCVALDAQQAGSDPFYLRWIDRECDILSEENGLFQVRHCTTGRLLTIPECFLHERTTPARFLDFSTHILPVSPGDTLSLLRSQRLPLGWYVKKNGVVGWYSGRISPTENK